MNEPRAWLEQWLYDTGAAMPGAVRQTAARLLADMEKAGLRIVSADALDTTERQRDELVKAARWALEGTPWERPKVLSQHGTGTTSTVPLALSPRFTQLVTALARAGVDTEEKPE